jgi:hypothetical protein
VIDGVAGTQKEEIFPQAEEEYERLSAHLEEVRAEGERARAPVYYQIGQARRR